MPPLGLIGLAFGLIMPPDLGTGAVMLGRDDDCFTAGAQMKHLGFLALGG